MKANKLLQVLRTLNHVEFQQFGRFVKSPFFNQSESLIVLYDYLAAFYPKFKSKKLTRIAAFKALYAHEEFNDKKLRDRFAHLLRLLREYLGFKNFGENHLEFRSNLVTEYYRKGLHHLIPHELDDMSETIDRTRIRNEEYYLNKYNWEVVKRKFDLENTPISKGKNLAESLTGEIDHIIHFFLIVMLKEYSRMFNIQNSVKSDYKMKFFEEIMNYLSREKSNYEDIILVNLLYRFLQMNRADSDESAVYELKNLIDKNKDSLEPDVFNIFYIELYNYCKAKQSAGSKYFGRLSFELIKEMLDKSVLLEKDGSMASHTYINIAASGLRDGNLEWAEEFINKYQSLVPCDARQNAFNYNYAVIYYMKGYGKDSHTKIENYNKALEYLSKVISEDFYYATRIKNHALKIYYELGYDESALSLIDTYRHYLSRNEMMPQHLVERYHNFISYLRRLLVIRLNEVKTTFPSLNDLKQEIASNSTTEYKGWLLDMIKELEMNQNHPQITTPH